MSEYICKRVKVGDGVYTVERSETEIVRCRDCKHGINGGNTCIEGAYEPEYWRPVEPDGFCAWGERKSE